MKTDCTCPEEKIYTIRVADYDRNNQLQAFTIKVCEKCRQWYGDLGLILTDDDIKKYFG